MNIKSNKLFVPRIVFTMVGLLGDTAVMNYQFNRMFADRTNSLYDLINESAVIMSVGGGIAFAVMNALVECGQQRGHPRWRQFITGMVVSVLFWAAFRVVLTAMVVGWYGLDQWYRYSQPGEFTLYAVLMLFWTFAAVAWLNPIKRVVMSLGVAVIFLFGFIPLWTILIDQRPVNYDSNGVTFMALWVVMMFVVPWLPDVLASLKTEKRKPKIA